MSGVFERSGARVAGFLAAAMLAVAPTVAGAQSLSPGGSGILVNAKPYSEGSVSVTVVWNPAGTTVRTEGSVPSGAQVASVHLVGAPVGDLERLGRITLAHDGVSEPLIHVDTEGTVSYPTASWPSTAWQGQLVSGQGSWAVVREPALTSELELTLVIHWVAAPGSGTPVRENKGGGGEVSVMDGKTGELDVEPYP